MLSLHLLDFEVTMKKLIGFLAASFLMVTAAPAALAHAVPVALIHTPVPSPVMTSEYGMRTHPVTGQRSFHGAIDLRAAFDQEVGSVFDGVVKAAGPRGLLGNAVEVFHPKKNITTIYGHLNSVSVRPGQPLKMGETLGLAGSTGRSTGVHVHLIVREGRKGKTLNPLIALNDASFPHVPSTMAAKPAEKLELAKAYTATTVGGAAGAKREPAKSFFASLMEAFTFVSASPRTADNYAISKQAESNPAAASEKRVSVTPVSRAAKRIASAPARRTEKKLAKSISTAAKRVAQKETIARTNAKRVAQKETIAGAPLPKRSAEIASAASNNAMKKAARLSQLQRSMEAATRDAANYQALLKEGIVSRNQAAQFEQAARTAKAALVACKTGRSNCS
jgi:hypothetical protein